MPADRPVRMEALFDAAIRSQRLSYRDIARLAGVDEMRVRQRVLRAMGGQDELEDEAFHVIAVEDGRIVGAGRGHFNSTTEAQIRYMAVEEELRGKGTGAKILRELESRLIEAGAKCIMLNARDNAVGFYEKYGYAVTEKSHTLFGAIPHFRMVKEEF